MFFSHGFSFLFGFLSIYLLGISMYLLINMISLWSSAFGSSVSLMTSTYHQVLISQRPGDLGSDQ
ncbi:hypothetical protein BDV25DRAFT_16699 [Aspergillus avenaceus]|uniref:Uncharacterized protein n=1 Tax=Aspergillus avenaceus TaxID=36643 RepID=A0A5N6TQI0_ASPAV|nr:hypothetical protein BDV25DRAFT_16699 [Aspergillus avenaceus]